MKLDSKISMSDVSDGFSRPTGSQAKPAFANTLILGRQIQKGVSTSSPPSIVVTPLAEKERKGTGEEGAAKSSPQVTFESNGHSAGHRNRRQRLLLYGTVFTTVNTFCIQSISDFTRFQVHKALISSYSKYFSATFNGYFNEAANSVVVLPLDSHRTFEIMHTWLYTYNFTQTLEGKDAAYSMLQLVDVF
ncbi:MAG: hypothetical protein ALECFALPRED_000883 [Alectoria fallacina]|uniref:BTB domain-containing protein n=1 Tax=Alectoria fallacina TaxID=1903189 RepID=A0A8H3F5G4_9LECA|nr:MAG: hypothetical protein ALECFALPRED_000883 [Alectoria fallacina]